MDSLRIFLVTCVAVVSVGYAGGFTAADADAVSARPLAPPAGVVEIDGVRLTGRLVEDGGKAAILFSAHNPTDRDVQVNFRYAAFHSGPQMMFSRMMSMPDQIASDECLLVAEAGQSVELSVPLEKPKVAKIPAVEREMWSPESWSLVVSRQEIGPDAVWGAAPPTPGEDVVSLGGLQIVLASSSFGADPDLG